MNIDLKRPCKDCPFKNDVPYQRGWLGKARAEGIIDSLYRRDESFPCHKTTHKHRHDQQHCAGAMILMERSGRANQWMRVSERLGYYDRNQLDMDTPVFDTPEQFVAWHSGSEVVTEYQMRQAKAAANREENEQFHAGQEAEPEPEKVKQWRNQKDQQMNQFLDKLQQDGVRREKFNIGKEA